MKLVKLSMLCLAIVETFKIKFNLDFGFLHQPVALCELVLRAIPVQAGDKPSYYFPETA